MSQVMMNLEQVKSIIFQLPVNEFLELVEDIEERAETFAMMCLAESSFREWDEEGEEIYDAEA